MAVDFGALRPANPLASFAQGQQYGTQLRQERSRRNALARYAEGDLEGAAAEMFAADDPEAAAALTREASRIAEERRRKDVGAEYAKDPGSARRKALESGDFDLVAEIGKLDADGRARAKAVAEDQGAYALGLKKIPYAQRRAKLAADRERLRGMGFSDAQIDGFDPTDEGLDGVAGAALSVKDQIDLAEKDQDRRKPDWKEVKGPRGDTRWVDMNPLNQRGGDDRKEAPDVQVAGGFDGAIGPLLKREGGYNASDGDSGAPVNFGINQAANPDIDVKNLTEEQAKAIYKERYWDAIDGDNLPPDAQAAVFDAAVNQGVGAALEMWKAAGGDVQKFADLRLQRYRTTRGYDRYGKAWEARVAETTPKADLKGDAGADGVSYDSDGRPTRAGSAAPEPDWTPDGKGNLVNSRTGDRKPDPTKGENPLSPESGLTVIGDPAQGLYRNAVGQRFQTNRAGTITRLAGPTDEQVAKATDRVKAVNDTLAMVDAVDEQLRKTRALGPGGRYVVNQEEFARLDSLVKQLQIAYKNAAELGAITGPDVPFIEAVAPNPRELRSLVQRGEFRPRLESLAKVAGNKYRAEMDAFKSLEGDPNGLTPLYKSPRSTLRTDRAGRVAPGAKPPAEKAGGKKPSLDEIFK
jgi:hypothetical protein